MIEEGKLTKLLTDKKTAHLYQLAHTGAATGNYDDPPTIDGAHGASLAFRTDTADISEALQGQMAIFILMASGGDFTADGSYATPVQVSFLFDGNQLLCKLPELRCARTSMKCWAKTLSEPLPTRPFIWEIYPPSCKAAT